MKPKTVIWLLFVCVIAPPLGAQQNQKLDSLLKVYESMPENEAKVDILTKLYDETLFSKTPKEAFPYAKQQLILAKKINYQIGQGEAFHNHANYYRNIDHYDSARVFHKKAMKIWKETNNKTGLYTTLFGWGKIEQLSGNFDLAIQKYDSLIKTAFELRNGLSISKAKREKATVFMDRANYRLAIREMLGAIKILDTTVKKDPILRADLLVGIGRIETLRENYKSALEPLNEGLKIFEDENDLIWVAITQIELGLAYLHLDQFDESIALFNKSLEYGRDYERTSFETISLNNLGIAYRKKGELETALKFLNAGLRIGVNSANNLANSYNEIGNVHLDKKEFSKAIQNYNKAIKIADSTQNMADLKNAYKWRSMAYQKSNQYKNALYDHQQYQVLRDSIFNTKKAEQIEELRTIYDIEKKEQQIAFQEQEITVLEQEASISNLQRILMGIGLLLSIIGFYAIRQKMKRNKLEKEKVDAELAFKKKELTTHALNLAKKNEVLETVKQKATALKLENNNKGFQDLIRTINFDQQDDRNWENFIQYFEQVHKDFSANIKQKYPEITSNELRLLALLKMNLSSKEIASILNISSEGIKKARYRLRKKLNLTTEDSLQDLVLSL